MRESLFERLKKANNTLINDFELICNLIYNTSDSVLFFLRNSFKESAFNIFFEDFDIALNEMIECNKELLLPTSLEETIWQIRTCSADLTLDCFLNYLEFFKTLLEKGDRYHN